MSKWIKAEEDGSRKFYTFPITMGGYGTNPDEAWLAAIEAFSQDPGEYESYEILEGE